MKHYLLLLSALLALGLFSCSKQGQSGQSSETATPVPTTLEVDSLLTNVDSYVGQEVTLEGLCTHICSHGGKKIFLMGSNEDQLLRVEAGEEIGSFAPETVNAVVRVCGKVVEDRIDEAYLQSWEEQLSAETEESAGASKGTCAREQKARGEQSQEVRERIADFRARIAEREAQEGKPYLSFYHVEGHSYEIVQ